jgi:transcriptional regulator with GAF, ATPase, and Fis domain
LGVLGYVLAMPEIGVRCAFSPVVNHFYEEFLYPENQEPLREGDRILQVGDRHVETWSQLLRKMLALPAEPIEVVTGLTKSDLSKGKTPPDLTYVELDGKRLVRVVYERPENSQPDGKAVQRSVWCRLGRSPVETLVPSVLWFFLKIGLFFVGAMVFWMRPEDRSASQFFWLCTLSFGAYMGGYHWARIVTQPILLLVFMVCAILLPAVTLHFYLVFPRPKALLQRQPRWVLAGIYGPAVFFLLLMLSNYLRLRWAQYGGSDGWGDDASVGVRLLLVEMLFEIYIYFGVAALWYLASVASLVHSYRTAANPSERNQVKWILFGALAAVIPISYSLYLAFWEQGRFGGGAATWPMFAASVCVTVAYTISITRYKLMQLDQLVSSGAVYFLISTLAGLLYYGLVFAGVVLVGSQVGEGPSLGQVLAVSTTALVLTAMLDFIRGRFKRVLDRHFRREKYQLDRTLQRMSRAIERLVDSPTLARQLLHTAAELLTVARGAVYLRAGEPALYRLTDALGPTPPLSELPPGSPLVEALGSTGMVGPCRPRGNKDPAPRQLQFLGGEVAQALIHEGELLGFLILGPKEGGDYTGEEVGLLAAFAQITVPALVSAEGHRTIEALNQDLKVKVEKIAEQQRRILTLQSQLKSAGREQVPGSLVRSESEDRIPNPESPPLAPVADGMVGSSPQIQQLMHLVRRVAASPSAVLLRGESGTGKELLARALHEHSPRSQKPFIKVHCAALSPGLLESELFGHVKGAFTSAIRDKVGRFELADGGSVFLDEIGDISLEVQTKLLRVLEEMTFERVGSSEPVKVDVRVITATHQDLESLMRQGRFREDLFFRLNVLPIVLPPLRERLEDIPELAAHFLRLYGQRADKSVAAIDDDVLMLLKAHSWPGNVRQLENVIERAVVIADGQAITVGDLPAEFRTAALERVPEKAVLVGNTQNGFIPPANGLGKGVASGLGAAFRAERGDRDRRERDHLVRALAAANGNKAEAARALGIARSTLISKLKKHGLS